MNQRSFLSTILATIIAAPWGSPRPACAQCQTQRIVGSAIAEQTNFGKVVAMNDEFAMIQSIVPNPAGGVVLGVYVFRLINGTWQQWKIIPDPQPVTGFSSGFGWSISVSGDLMAVGAPYDNHPSQGAGLVYLFARDAGGANQWGLIRTIAGTGVLPSDHFGMGVAIDAETLVVGAPDTDDLGSNSGAAYFFSRNAGGPEQWGQVRRVVAPDGAANHAFGSTTTLTDGVACICAPYANGATSQAGAVYVRAKDYDGPDQWGHVAKLTASDGHSGDLFGRCAASSGSIIAIGAPNADTIYNDYGAAYIFERDNASPPTIVFRQKITGLDLTNSPDFGGAIALRSDRLLIGDILDDQNSSDAGAAYVFMPDQKGVWRQTRKIVPGSTLPIQYFGYAVAISDQYAIVGAPYSNVVGPQSGCAWTHALDETDCNANGVCDSIDLASGTSVDANANGVLDDCETGCQSPALVPAGLPAQSGFGSTLAVDADTVLVGAPNFRVGNIFPGAAWALARDPLSASGWTEPAPFTPSIAESGDQFGYAVAVHGEWACIGSPAGADEAGRAFLFHRESSGSWAQVAIITSPTPGAFQNFASSAAMDGDTLVIGEPTVRRVHVYERNLGGSNAWGLSRSVITSFESFGFSVALDGDTLVVGAATQNAPLSDSGAAYVLSRNQGGANMWGIVKTLLASDAAASDRFGQAVDVDDDLVVIGASGVDGTGPDFGAAYVFERDLGGAGNWGQRTRLNAASYARSNAVFGRDVAVSDDRVLVGMPENFAPLFNPGRAFLFERHAGGADAWGQSMRLVLRDPAAYDHFGCQVALDGDRAVFTSELRDQTAVNSGAAFQFNLYGADCNLNRWCDDFDVRSDMSPDVNRNGVPDECESLCESDVNGDGQVNVGDLLAVISSWGPCADCLPPSDCPADIAPVGALDCQVNVTDLLAVISNWGACP